MGSRLESNSNAVRKRIEKHTFEDEEGDEYEGSKFGGFPEYFRRKQIKLQNLDAELRSQSKNNPPIFRGVVANVNGYTQPSLRDLHSMIVSHGGGFLQYLDGKTAVTHIIASNLPPKKAVEFRRYRIVKPAWVVDSVKAGRLLPWDAYRVLDEGVGQRILGFENGNVVSQVSTIRRGYRDQTDASWYTSQLKASPAEDAVTDAEASKSQASDSIDDGNIRTQTTVQEAEITAPANEEKYNHGKETVPLSPVSQFSEHRLKVPTLNHEESFWQEVQAAAEQHHDTSPLTTPTVTSPISSNDVDGPKVAKGETESAPTPLMEVKAAEASQQSDIMEEAHDTASEPTNKAYLTNPEADETTIGAEVQKGAAEEQVAEVSGGEPELDQKTTGVALDVAVQTADSGSRPSLKRTHSSGSFQRSKKVKMTAEEHNSELLADPRMWKSSVVNPGFLEQYYRESRLHHLSSWKADLKSQLQALMAEKTASQKAKLKRPPGTRRYILHVDFDSFFAAISLKKYPQWVDKPAVVAHGGGSGSEIASCNYPARKYGVKNGMWMKRAQEICPELKILPYDFPAYEQASRDFYDAILSIGGMVQSVSVDEALVDITALVLPAGGLDGKSPSEGSIWREQAKADEIAQNLRGQVKERTGCAVSVGIGGNILLAKLALRKAKPAGQFQIKPEEVLEFIGKLEVQDLPGIADSIGGRLEEIGVKYVKDIRDFSKEKLMTTLGPKTGEKIWDYARGIDRTEVGEQVIRKSVSAEVNWGVRFENQAQVDEFIGSLCGELHKRLVKENVKGRQLTMKIMRRSHDAPLDPPKQLGHGKCDTFNKSLVLGVATNAQDILTKEALSILKGYGFSPGELRGIGIQMQRLEPLKVIQPGQAESSQKLLQFKAKGENAAPEKESEDPIIDDIVTPKKAKSGPPEPATSAAFRHIIDSPSRKPLNTLGTQFILPTQVDEKVLAELPESIRTKLTKHKLPTNLPTEDVIPAPPAEVRSRSATPTLHDIPFTESQLDPDTLEALPAAVRAEVLAAFKRSPRKAHEQAVLPQSPRKVRTIPLTKKLVSANRKRGGGLLSRIRGHDNNSTLTQSNFVTAPGPTSRHASPAWTDNDNDGTEKVSNAPQNVESAEISSEFLAALPQDLRREVLLEHRRDHLKRSAGIDIVAKRKLPKGIKPGSEDQLPSGQRVLRLPPRPPKPTFTTKKLYATEDIRHAIREWYEEFNEDGPYKEDVEALGKYLAAVVGEERDLGKAVCFVRWAEWIVDQGGGDNVKAEGSAEWKIAVESLKQAVQEAVKERGLGRVEF